MGLDNLGHSRFSLISPKLNGLAARAIIIDCFIPRPCEITITAVLSAFCSWMSEREDVYISAEVGESFS